MESIITFNGQNVQLFSKMAVENYTAKTALIVPETHNAILVKDGQMLQTLSSGKHLIGQFVDLKTEAESKLEVLFMSKTAKLKLMWGTANKFIMYDATLQDNYHLGMSGDFDVQIGDPRKCYLYLVGADSDLTSTALQERLMSTVVAVLENVVTEYVEKNKVLFNQISVCKREISVQVQKQLHQKLMSEYGIAVFSFNIANIIIDEEDLDRLNRQYKLLKKTDSYVCRECGAVLKENDKFCSACGRRVEIGKKCPNCFTENADDAKFCSACGQKL